MSLGLRQTLMLRTLCVTASVLAPFVVQSASTHRISSRAHANSVITMSDRVVRVKGNGVVHAGNNQAKVWVSMCMDAVSSVPPDQRHDPGSQLYRHGSFHICV